MNWDDFFNAYQKQQPKLTWDEYFKKANIKPIIHTTEMLYNPNATPKTKYTDEDFMPLDIQWQFDFSKYGQYDETDPLEQLRKMRNVPPKAILSQYNFEDKEDVQRFKEGRLPKAIERKELTERARKEAQAYIQERQRMFEEVLKSRQPKKLFGVIPIGDIAKIEPEEYTPETKPDTIAAWEAYKEQLAEYENKIAEMQESGEYAYRALLGNLPKPPEPPPFDIPAEFERLDEDLWEKYIKQREQQLAEEKRKSEDSPKRLQKLIDIILNRRDDQPTGGEPQTPVTTSTQDKKRWLNDLLEHNITADTLKQAIKDIFTPSQTNVREIFKVPNWEAYKEAILPKDSKVTWGTVFKNILKIGAANLGASTTKTLRTLFEWLPDDIERAIQGGKTFKETQQMFEQRAEEAAQEMEGATGLQKFVYTGGAESIPLLANFLLSTFFADTATSKAGKIATNIASRIPYLQYFYGSYAREAEREGATPEQQILYGLIGATVETVTEAPIVENMLTRSLGKGLASKLLMKAGGKNLVSRLGRVGVEALYNIATEAGQEALAGIASNIAKKLIYAPDTEIVNWEQIAEDAYGGFAMGTILTALGLPVRYQAYKMADALIDKAAKGEKVTAEEVVNLAEQTKQDIANMSPAEKAEATRQATENAKPINQILSLPAPSEQTLAHMQFNAAIENIRNNLNIYANNPNLDENNRQTLKNTIVHDIQLVNEIAQKYNFELPNYIKNVLPTIIQQAEARESRAIPVTQTEQKMATQIAQTAPLPEQVQGEIPPDAVRALNVDEINVDPARFQFKADVDTKTGASKTLDIKKWDPYLAGVVLVWQDKNGRYWIVNGHHRLQKAKELGVKTINAHVIRETDGYTDRDARELGAKINIAEGHGTLTDAAKLFRDGGYTLERIQEEGLPLRSGNALKGLYLAQLNDNLFDKVVTKQISEEIGAIIGQILPTDKGGINDAKQNYIWSKIKDTKVNADEVREMAEMLRDTDTKPRVEQTLLGEWLVWDIADFDIKPKLIAETKRVIISNKNAFAKVLKNAKVLKEAGNILVDEENIKRKDLLNQALVLLDNGKNKKGDPINEIFNKYTEQIKAGMSKSTAAEKAANEIVELIASGEYLRQVTPQKQRGQISMIGGSESEVQERDSGQSEGVSGNTGEISPATTEAAAEAEWQAGETEQVTQQPSEYAQYIGKEVRLKPPYGRVTVKGETDTHIIVDKKGQEKRILKSAFDRLLISESPQPTEETVTTQQTAQTQQQSESAREYTENLYQALLSNHRNLFTEGGIYYGKEGALRLAREYGYGLASYPEKEIRDAIQISYGQLVVRLYDLKPPINAKQWANEIRKAIEEAKQNRRTAISVREATTETTSQPEEISRTIFDTSDFTDKDWEEVKKAGDKAYTAVMRRKLDSTYTAQQRKNDAIKARNEAEFREIARIRQEKDKIKIVVAEAQAEKQRNEELADIAHLRDQFRREAATRFRPASVLDVANRDIIRIKDDIAKGKVTKQEILDIIQYGEDHKLLPPDHVQFLREQLAEIEEPLQQFTKEDNGEIATQQQDTKEITQKEPWQMTREEWLTTPRIGVMYYTFDPKTGRVTRWGEIVSIDNDNNAKVYWPNNPKDYKYSTIPVSDIQKWLREKQIWAPEKQLTKDNNLLDSEGEHKNIVKQALAEGKPVPEEVLKDYPDLAEQSAKQETAEQIIQQSKEKEMPTEDKATNTVETKATTKEITLDNWLDSISENDLDYETLRRSYNWISWRPEDRAKADQREYVRHMQEIYNKFKDMAQTPEAKQVLLEELEKYRQNYIRHIMNIAEKRSRTASPAITGPAKFNTKSNEKALHAEEKAINEYKEWRTKAQKSIEQKLKQLLPQETVQEQQWPELEKFLNRNIASLVGIKNGTLQYDASAFRNSIRGKLERLAVNGNIGLVQKALKYIQEMQDKYDVTILAPNSKVWEYLKVDTTTATTEARPTGIKTIAEYDGVTIVNNHDAERVQIIFDDKPSAEVINALKKEGWRWSPSNKAWQRKNTVAAINSAQRIISQFYQAKEVPPHLQGTPDESATGIMPRQFARNIEWGKPEESTGYRFANQDLEQQYQAAHGLPQQTFIDKVKAGIEELWDMATRTYKEIPENDPYYAEAVFLITQTQNVAGLAKDEGRRMVDYVTQGLTKEEYNTFERYLFLMDMKESLERGEAIWAGWDEQTVNQELERIQPYLTDAVKLALERRRENLDRTVQNFVGAMAELGIDVSDVFNRRDYFRHQVLEYANAKNFGNYSSKGKAPKRRGFMMERSGEYTGAYNTNWLEAEFEVLAQMVRDTKMAQILKRFMDKYDISEQVKQRAKEQGLDDWHKAIPEGYTTYQLRDGNVFYMTTSIAEQIVQEIINNAPEGAVVKPEDLKAVLAVGGRYKEYVIKEELAAKLKDLLPKPPSNAVTIASQAIQNAWKRWVTGLNPMYFIKFNLRNLTGDIPRALYVSPRIFKYVPKAIGDIYNAMKHGKFSNTMWQWTERGGFQGLLIPQETQDINKYFPRFNQQETNNKLKQFMETLEKIPPNTVKRWAEMTENVSNFREAILRYASFLYFLDAQEKGIPNYGAAPPAMVRGLDNPVDRAFVLADYAIGAYSRTSELGRHLSRHLIPFWRFIETNFKAHYQILKNAVDGSIIEEQLQYKGKIPTKFRKILQGAMNLTAKTALIWGLGLISYVYNALRWPEEEELLPDHVKAEPHIILGVKEDGRIIYFTRIGVLQDVLEWVVDTGDVVRFLSGETTAEEIVKKMPRKALQKVVDSISPLYKVPFELVAAKRLYPDALRPSNIRDRNLYAFQALGLEWIGRKILGLPAEDILEMLNAIIAYQTDPDAAAYQTILDRKREFEQEQGKYPTQIYNESPKSYALYNYKLALKYKDLKTAKKFLDMYLAAGGTKRGLKQSMKMLDPLYGLSAKEQKEFIKWLSESDRAKLARAQRYYQTLKSLGEQVK